jgi:hypothetical protein
MRRILLFAILASCRGSDPEPASADTGVEDEEDAIVCPPALGTAAPRTTMPSKLALDDTLHMNHLQLEATHNSYHLKSPGGASDWNYQHAPIETQLSEQGVRGLELDTHYNEACGRYEVYHLPRFDEGTTCRVFTECLQKVRTWSDAHPSHHPLFIHLEPKDGVDASNAEQRFTAMENEILTVFPRELVITPDEVRGSAPTLRDAVTTTGWPTLGKARGRVLFYIDRSDSYRDLYAHGKKDLNGRLMFTDAGDTDPFAAVLVRNGALDDKARITALVKQGFIVRTFADKSISASLAGDSSQLTAALEGGAQILSTDFPAKIPETSYFVEIPSGTPSRCNPITAPTECTNDALEK